MILNFAKFAICALLVSGCALVEDRVPIIYTAPANMTVVENASIIPISVTAQDGRISNRDRVGTKKNGYGMEMAKITAANDVVELVRHAVEHEFESFGFRTGTNGLTTTVELQTFYNDFKPGFFSGDAVAEVSFNIAIKRQDGSLLYSHSYRGIGMNKNIALAIGSQAAPALQEALTNALQQLVTDQALQSALAQAVLPRVNEAASRSSRAR